MNNRILRKIHRYLGLIIGVQLLLWTVSGLYFSWNRIEEVRSEHLMSENHDHLEIEKGGILSPTDILESVRRDSLLPYAIHQVTLRLLLDEPVYEVHKMELNKISTFLIDARTGIKRSPISESEAIEIATRDFSPGSNIINVTHIIEAPKRSEYRNKPLPAYRIEIDHESNTRIYVSADRGIITARRSGLWRTFDFLWMFHIMDYDGRDNFNNLILRVFSVLGVATVLSGFLLWGFSSPVFRRRNSK